MGGGDEKGLENMRIENVQGLDPLSEARQIGFWNQAQQYAATSPFQSQYGGASSMPGLGGMSGSYATNNLGFSNYAEPAGRNDSPGWAYDPNIEAIPGQKAPVVPFVPPKLPDPTYDPTTNTTPPPDPNGPAEPQGDGLSPAGTTAAATSGFERTPAEIAAGVQAGGLGAWKEKNRAANAARAAAEAARAAAEAEANTTLPEFGNNFEMTGEGRSAELGAAAAQAGLSTEPQYDFRRPHTDEGGLGFDPFGEAAESGGAMSKPPISAGFTKKPGGAGMPGIDIDRPDGYSSTVGIEEIQRAGDATRQLLGQAGPGTPGYERVTPGAIGGTSVVGPGRISTTTGRIGDPTASTVSGVTPSGVAATTVGNQQPFSLYDEGTVSAGPSFAVTPDTVTPTTMRGTGTLTYSDIANIPQLALEKEGEVPTPFVPLGGESAAVTTAFTPAVLDGPTTVTPDTFGGASYLGSDLAPYMDQLGVDAQVEAAGLDYARAQNEEQARRAGSHAWGTRGDIPRAEQETAMLARIADIRRQGFTQAADRLESDLQRQQAAGMQSQQLGTQAALQTQSLAQAGDIRGAELGVQAGLADRQLQAQRLEANAARAQQAAQSGQQLGVQAGMQTQQLEQQAQQQNAQNYLAAAQANQRAALEVGSQARQLESSRQVEQARLGLQADQQTQQLGVQAGMQTQQLDQQRRMQNANNQLTAAQTEFDATLQTQDRQAQIDAQRRLRDAELQVQTGMQTQQLQAQAGRQTQQLQSQVGIQNAQNAIQVAQANQQAAQQTNDRQAQIDAQRQLRDAELGLDAAVRNQGTSLQAAGMGLDAQGMFRQQQMGAAGQLADLGGMRQGATFGAAGQLAGMGAAQEQAQRAQQAYGYDQWLRGIEGGAEQLAMLQSMQPGGQQYTYGRKPSMAGQIAGGLLQGAGAVTGLKNAFTD